MAFIKPRAGAGDTGSQRNVLAADGRGEAVSKAQSPELQAASATMPVADIRVGQRHRKDMGDIDALAANIQRVGLLQPIVVTPDGFLLCGERRLRAAKLLGWKTIPVMIVTAPIESRAAARRGAK